MSTVLVTGGSGFLGSHCILELLRAGYEVCTTVRSLDREAHVRGMLRVGGVEPGDSLSFVEADLCRDDGWPEAVAGCEFVLHVASPIPSYAPKRQEDLIVPARDGTLRVLRASREAGVKRVVFTSSFAAIGYGHPPRDRAFDETDWTDLDGDGVYPYVKSKTLAERAAWDFVNEDGNALELAVVNPVAILGPVLSGDYATLVLVVQKLMDGEFPACPNVWLGVVDVRDVADLQLRAMTHPAANGERILATAGGFVTILDIAVMLRSNLGEAARRVPTRKLPSWIVRLAALVSPTVRQALPELDRPKSAANDKAKRALGWEPRSIEETIVDTAESMRALNLLRS